MDLRSLDIITTIILSFIHFANTENILSCSVSKFNNSCRENQKCDQSTLQCQCLEGFVEDGDECISESSKPASDHDVTAAVVSIFTIALVVAGLVLVIRKYNLIEYIRQKIALRRNHDIMYEDVMIGQDDPP
ncbi:unnamed protein product [Danaus chrysippus]|uniref:(African queen) hypothetical protein n=1 Tax=Danaus chrysippus TaxID=151541 RepID=A0A8J2QPL7_9NEOP|nr:unnamed protein product [Danaus chrysippus]